MTYRSSEIVHIYTPNTFMALFHTHVLGWLDWFRLGAAAQCSRDLHLPLHRGHPRGGDTSTDTSTIASLPWVEDTMKHTCCCLFYIIVCCRMWMWEAFFCDWFRFSLFSEQTKSNLKTERTHDNILQENSDGIATFPCLLLARLWRVFFFISSITVVAPQTTTIPCGTFAIRDVRGLSPWNGALPSSARVSEESHGDTSQGVRLGWKATVIFMSRVRTSQKPGDTFPSRAVAGMDGWLSVEWLIAPFSESLGCCKRLTPFQIRFCLQSAHVPMGPCFRKNHVLQSTVREHVFIPFELWHELHLWIMSSKDH